MLPPFVVDPLRAVLPVDVLPAPVVPLEEGSPVELPLAPAVLLDPAWIDVLVDALLLELDALDPEGDEPFDP